MTITVNVQIQAPELANAIEALASALATGKGVPATVQAAATTAPVQEVEHAEQPARPVEDTPKAEDKKLPTLVDVRAKLAELSRAGKRAEVKELIQNYGVSKLTDIPSKHYPELMMKAELLS